MYLNICITAANKTTRRTCLDKNKPGRSFLSAKEEKGSFVIFSQLQLNDFINRKIPVLSKERSFLLVTLLKIKENIPWLMKTNMNRAFGKVLGRLCFGDKMN